MQQAIRASGGLDASAQLARQHAEAAIAALAALPGNAWTDALRTLATYAVERES